MTTAGRGQVVSGINLNTTIGDLYRALEDDNQHNLCSILVAVASEDSEAVIRLTKILQTHRATGMTGEMSRERYDISQPLYRALAEATKRAGEYACGPLPPQEGAQS